MTTNDSDHLSIGEVLALLQDDFPDVTISKIRFLESQGLIDPERTPSGYRKFYENDIERLRWILLQQRENFLPLKIIKSRLEAAGTGVPELDIEPLAPRLSFDAEAAAEAGGDPDGQPAHRPPTPTGVDASPAERPSTTPSTAPATVRASMPAGEAPNAPVPIWMADVARTAPRPSPAAGSSPLAHGQPTATFSLEELAAAAELSTATIRELEQYGLLQSRSMGSDSFYDADALVIAQKSARFIAHGIEARHLRMFKVSAEREAGFLEQVVMPLLKQRNPAAREQAVVLLAELAGLGQDLRGALLRSNLQGHLRPS